jgi:hypothetical protein
VFVLGIAMLLGLAPPETSPARSGPCDASVRTIDLDEAAFLDATRLRLPDLRLRSAQAALDGDPACQGRLHAFVEVRPSGAGEWELALIFGDGRAWFRSIASEPDEAARTAASALANLLAAIEEDEVAPDAEHVALPVDPELQPQPQPDPPARPPPEPPEPAREPELEIRPEAPLRFEIGPRLSAQGIAAAAPAPAFRAFGAELAGDLRLPLGVLVGLGLRIAGRPAGTLSLIRTQVAVGFGYALRKRRFEMPMMIRAELEPWLVREQGQTRKLGAPPLLGAGVRVAPGGLLDVGRTRLRVGVVLGVDVLGEPNSGRVPSIRFDPTSDPLVHVGGIEFAIGLDLGWWIPVRGR